MEIIERLVNSFVFWAAWIVIPLIMEVLPSIGSFFVLLRRILFEKEIPKPIIYPEISIIVPVYNSEHTLGECIKSINDCDYPNDKIRIFLVNNQGKDHSFDVFKEYQKRYPDLLMQWLNAEQGKSRALNLALYNSEGKYIIHIDSDGILEKSALNYMVDKFEAKPSINCMTGAIMIQPELIEEYPRGKARLFRKMEFMEYAQAFLAGRNYASDLDSIYTVSGAFSAFRKSAILKSRLYNTETLAEDTQITFQMRYIQGERIYMSEKSIFFVDPIDDMDKLYTQRQRWQRGSLEVSKMFVGSKMKTFHMFSDVSVKTLMYDHTFAFPRIIWYLALICLMFVGYSGKTVLMATALLFGMYTLCGYLYFISIIGFLRDFPDVKKYYMKQWWIVPILPFFNLLVFFIRFAGIINSINTGSAWKTRTLSEERKGFVDILKKDFGKAGKVLSKVRGFFNGDPELIYAKKTLEQQARGGFFGYFICILMAVLAVVLTVVCHWASNNYSVKLQEIINTLLGPLAGAGNDMLYDGLKQCLPVVLTFLIALVIFVSLERWLVKRVLRQEDQEKKRKGQKRILLIHRVLATLCTVGLVSSLVYANSCYNLVGYVKDQLSNSSFYEKYYVDPSTVSITAEQPRNLIYIYLESMENTYASKSDGGSQPVNYIPKLTKLARENVSFSQNDKLGGFYANYGATWTMGAMFTTTSGVPYDLPVKDTAMADQQQFASGLITIGDILKKEGYTNEFLCGSDAEFGGRKKYLTQHGDYEIFDYYTAMEKGYVPSDYYEWWGIEDQKLYEIAKDEVTRLAEKDEPFNLTMLTVDTHATDGYICEICENTYDEKAANVVKCADNQLAEFIEWCKEQPFYDNTTIVITGDHPRMDNALIKNKNWNDRRVYNCFINGVNTRNAITTNRECMAFDIFPTVLAAMGYEIEGERLGLGTNLFSNQQTLAEKMGIADIEAQLAVHSDYYISHFAPELMGTDR